MDGASSVLARQRPNGGYFRCCRARLDGRCDARGILRKARLDGPPVSAKSGGLRIGIDLGGTKIEAIALDPAGAVRLRHRVPTPVGDYEGILDAVAGLVAGTERELGTQGTVGVATPGALSTRTGLIKNSNSTALNGKPLDCDLASRLGR